MFKLFKLFGVPVRVHWSFLILLFWIGSSLGVWATALLIASVLAHEFGHVLVARRYGYHTRDVTAMGLGLVANIGSDMKRGEFSIAIAGPIVNFVIAGVLFGLKHCFPYIPKSWFDLHTLFLMFAIVDTVMISNIVLGMFNMLPLFPLDGGRALRSTMTRFMGNRTRATRVAAYIGTAIAVLLMPLAVWTMDVVLMIILPLVVVFSWHEVRRLEETGVEPHMY